MCCKTRRTHATGQYADFHAFRHTYISNHVRTGASPKTAQTLARHSDVRMTLERYAHAGLFDLTAAVDSLSGLVRADKKNVAQAATGTEGRPDFSGPNLGPQSENTGDKGRQTGREVASVIELTTQKTPEKPRFSGVFYGFDSRGG